MEEQLIEKVQALYQESLRAEERLDLIASQLNELRELKEGMKHLDMRVEGHMLASVGKGIFIRTFIKDPSLFVDVGDGILIKKTHNEIALIIEEQTARLDNMKSELQEELADLRENFSYLAKKIGLQGDT